MENQKVIFINGFTKDETFEIMRAVKAAVKNPGDIAFSMGTETNREWRIQDLIKEVREEHEYMTKNKQ